MISQLVLVQYRKTHFLKKASVMKPYLCFLHKESRNNTYFICVLSITFKPLDKIMKITCTEQKQIEECAMSQIAETPPFPWEEKSIEQTSDAKNTTRITQEAEMEVVMYLEYVGGKASVHKVKDNVHWQERFEPTCGEIHAFLHERSIFALSGNNDYVTMLRNNIRKVAVSKKSDILIPSPVTPTAPINPGISIPPRKIGRAAFVSREKSRQRDVPVDGTGKIAISCISQAIDLDALQRRFRQWDYITTLADKVLHVTRKKAMYVHKPDHELTYCKDTSESSLNTQNCIKNLDSNVTHDSNMEAASMGCEDDGFNSDPEHFDLFVFSYGAIVWWGYDMSIYKTIEMEFSPFSSDPPHSEVIFKENAIIREPYPQKYVKDLFPVWCTYEATDPTRILKMRPGGDSQSSSPSKDSLHMLYSQDFPHSLPNFSNSAFLEALQRDHILLPIDIPAVKQAISHALAQSAKLDIIEPGVRDLLSICKPLPVQIKEKGSTTIKHTEVNKLKGQLFLLRMELKSDSELFDEPEFFWEFPWFKQIFRIVRDDYCIESRISLLDEKLSAVQLTLDMIGNQFSEQHGRRLEWIIIILILIEVLIAVAELLLEMGYGVRK